MEPVEDRLAEEYTHKRIIYCNPDDAVWALGLTMISANACCLVEYGQNLEEFMHEIAFSGERLRFYALAEAQFLSPN